MTRVRDPRPGPLTQRQYDVLVLVAQGNTNAQIGRRLGIAHDSVRAHVAHVLRRLDAVSRAHAVHRAHVLGLLPVAAPTDDDPQALAAQIVHHIAEVRAINRRLHELNQREAS